MITKRYSTDVTITCPCCNGSAVIRLRRYRYICRLASPAHEQAIHAAVSETRPHAGV